ncbi:MAG: hypothetical protein ABH857_03240 [Elusimicrobiota bacterium]
MRQKILFQTLLFIIILLTLSNLYSMNTDLPIDARAYVSTNTITIGERFIYTVDVMFNKDILLDEFNPENALNEFEIKNVTVTGPGKQNLFSKKYLKRMQYELSVFKAGYYAIPGFDISYTTPEVNKAAVTLQGIDINVVEIKREKGDTDDIRDIKRPKRAYYPVWFYIVGVLLMAVFVGGILYYLYSKKKLLQILGVEEKIIEPPDVIALRELQRLKTLGYIEEGLIKEFYIGISETIRVYLESGFNVEILDKTTHEVYFALKNAKIDKKLVTEIKEFLEECDLVKFAKFVPDKKVIEEDYDTAVKIVKERKHTRGVHGGMC